MWSMTCGLKLLWPERRGDGATLSETLLKGVELWRLRRGRLNELLGCGVLYWKSWDSSVSIMSNVVCISLCHSGDWLGTGRVGGELLSLLKGADAREMEVFEKVPRFC